MKAFASAARRSRSIPLEFKLPLLTVTLLSAALAAFTWLSYVEVRRATVRSARSRVEHVANGLAITLELDAASTLRRMRDIAADPSLGAYLSGGVATEVAARAVLDRLAETAAADSLVPAVILSRDGSPLLWAPSDAETDVVGRDELSATMAAAPADGGYGPVFWKEGQVRSWATVPVLSAHEQIGWLAQLHVLDAELQTLIIDSTTAGPAVRLASTPGELWSTLDGEPVPAPAAWPFDGARDYEHATGEQQLAYATRVAGTAWSVVAEVSAGEIRAGVRDFARRIALAAAGLIVAATCAAWLLGRGLTNSMRRLRASAQAIADGDGEPVVFRRRGELGALAAALDAAALQVQARRRELEVQHGEARQLAADLVRQNAGLEQNLAIEKAALARAERTRQSAAADLTRIHREMRAPVKAIVGYAELVELEVHGPLTARQRDQIARIRSSGMRLLHLMDELVDARSVASDPPGVAHPSRHG